MYDAIIVGGSYAGLSAAMQLGRSDRKICIIDNSKPRNRFTDASHGFFGQDGMAPMEAIRVARSHVERYPSVTMVSGTVTQAHTISDRRFVVILSSGEPLEASKLLFAFGQVDLLPDLPGVAERWGLSVLHCPYCHGWEYRNRFLGVLLMHPISIHQAILVSDWGPTTLFLNGQDAPDAITRRQLALRRISIETEVVESLEGRNTDLSVVRLVSGRTIPCEALYIAPRQRLGSRLAEDVGCTIDNGSAGHIVRTDDNGLTTVPGVYAAGDITQIKQSATFASSNGVLAGSSLHRELVYDTLSVVV